MIRGANKEPGPVHRRMERPLDGAQGVDGAVGARPASPAEAGLPVAGGDGP